MNNLGPLDFEKITYKEAVSYLINIPRFTKKRDMNSTREFMDIMDNPQDVSKVIHVAGTNGKGSVCAYISEILKSDGKKVGLFTSPHLIKINERIRINGCCISDDDFLRIFKMVMLAISEHMSQGYDHPTFFEVIFAMAVCFFRERKCDYVVLETGLGGRLDATNVVKKPILSIITSIDYDHTEYLGDTIEEIASEKGGIIKENVPVIFEYTNIRVWKVLKAISLEKKSQIVVANDSNLSFESRGNHILVADKYAYNSYKFRINTGAIYQAKNAHLAILASWFLKIDIDSVKEGLINCYWSGRMEQLSNKIYVDGAHNVDGIKWFIKSAKSIIAKENEVLNAMKRHILVLSVVADKNYDEMVKEIVTSNFFDVLILTKVPGNRALDTDKLYRSVISNLDKLNETVYVYDGKNKSINMSLEEIHVLVNIEDAIKYALQIKQKDDYVFFTGSLYSTGTILKFFKENDIHD